MKKRLTILLALVMLGGCSLFSFSDDDVNVLVTAKELLKGQLDEQGEQKKIKIPLRVNYSITHKAMIDRDMTIEFEFLTEQALPILRFAVTTDDGLELVSNNIDELYRGLKTREVLKRRVIVRPTRENKFYLSLYIVTEIGDDKRAKLIRIPIAVGDYSLSDNPTPQQ